MDNIEIIYDELKRNQIHIDKHALSFHINKILNENKDIYSQIHALDIEQLYQEINITNFGRTVAYLACVYLQSEDEETVRRNIRRCVGELRSFDIPNLRQSNQRPILITLSLALIAIYISVYDSILVHFTPSFEVNHVHIFNIFGLMGLMFVYRQFVLYFWLLRL